MLRTDHGPAMRSYLSEQAQALMSRILVIDDENDVRVLAQAALEAEGHTVRVAADGVEGMRIARREPLDLVVTDLVMPEKEGIETIHDLRQEFPDLPIIAISGGGRAGADVYLDTAAELGADVILQKPFAMAALASAVRQLLARPVAP